MKNQLDFSLTNLLYGTEPITGPLTQMLFVTNFLQAKRLSPRFNRLARIEFSNPLFHQSLPGGRKLEETLLIGDEKWNDTGTFFLCIRGKSATCWVATATLPDGAITIHHEYEHALLMEKLTASQLKELFSAVWTTRAELIPKFR